LAAGANAVAEAKQMAEMATVNFILFYFWIRWYDV
jgi:hypothetical protein